MPPSRRAIRPRQLKRLWKLYVIFRSSQVAPSTVTRDYARITRWLGRCPLHLTTSVEIRDWMLENYSAEVTRRFLVQLNACCKWAVESDLLTANPFAGLPKQFKRKMNQVAVTAFSQAERDVVIKAFEDRFLFYGSWVKFLFWTGCRPEEAAGLTWENVAPDCSWVHFRVATPIDTRIPQDTKTHKARKFPCNSRLSALLRSIRPSPCLPMDRVFPGPQGGIFDYHNFQERVWKPTVLSLVASGEIAGYLPQSHTRHTFITLALQHMTVKDVAYLVGNTPDILFRFYASRSRVIEVPEF